MEIVEEKYAGQLLQSRTFERWVLALRENPSRLLHSMLVQCRREESTAYDLMLLPFFPSFLKCGAALDMTKNLSDTTSQPLLILFCPLKISEM